MLEQTLWRGKLWHTFLRKSGSASCSSTSVKVTLSSRVNSSQQPYARDVLKHSSGKDVSHRSSSLPAHSSHHIPINTLLLVLLLTSQLQDKTSSYLPDPRPSYSSLKATIRDMRSGKETCTERLRGWSTLSPAQGWARQPGVAAACCFSLHWSYSSHSASQPA